MSSRLAPIRNLIVERFAKEAPALRDHFDEQFADPRRTHPERFVWDYWHVPQQYTQLRTPAYNYFPHKVYAAFHNRLVAWGRSVLGCHDVSPPWLSCYIDGCSQELHADVPHGPWAFVFSLTKARTFVGGETLLACEGTLDYWSNFASSRFVEHDQLYDRIAPTFNRLIVFDPRFPHGVSRVSGATDPRAGRLVVHGWFVQPRPFIQGPLPPRALQVRIDDTLARFGETLRDDLRISGTTSIGFRVTPAGEVRSVRLLSNTLRAPNGSEREREDLLRFILRTIRAWTFPRTKRESHVTLPFVFETD